MQSKPSWLRRVAAIALAVLITVGVAPVAQSAPMTQATPAGEAAQAITVLGYGEAVSPADSALVRLSISTAPQYSPSGVPEFTPMDEESMQIVVDALVENGIAASEIMTNTFGWSSFTGTAAGEVSFSYAEPANLTTLLSAVQKTLRSRRGPPLPVAGTSFRVDDCLALEAEAWEAALADARQRAERVADLMEVELGGLVSVTELEPTISPYGASLDGGGCSSLEAVPSGFMPVPSASTNSASAVRVAIRLQATYTFE